MNDATMIGAAQVEDVRAYVAAVRAWLADLPADEVEDLTAGMEADLAERAAESGGTLGDLLGQPEAYAAELRSAAGLPPRVEVVVPDAVSHEPWTDRLDREAHELVGRHPWLRELRLTWWLARGAVAGWALASVLGTGGVLLLPLVGAALSVWLGLVLRGREPLGTKASAALGVANTLAVVLLLPMLADYTSASYRPSDPSAFEQPVAPGLSANGSPITNVYAYDAAGQRVADVRLYDQYGQPITVSADAVPVPVGPNGEDVAAWPPDERALSVFPMRLVPGADPWAAQQEGGWTPPMVVVPLAGSAQSSATPSPSTSAGPSASATDSPTPTGTPTPNP